MKPTMKRETAQDLAYVMRVRSGIEVKYAKARITKAPTDGSGVFQALVSTFGGEPDVQNDVIAPGAFTESIRTANLKRADRGGEFLWPMFFANNHKDPDAAIGGITSAVEAPQGLVVEGRPARPK